MNIDQPTVGDGGDDGGVSRRKMLAGSAVAGAAWSVPAVLGTTSASAQTSPPVQPRPGPGIVGVIGNAYGYEAYGFALFGGPQPPIAPTPEVTLAADASNSPQTASATQGEVTYGPATFFSSGLISVHTEGSLGPTGSVMSSSTVNGVNRSGSEPLSADVVQSTCSADADAVFGTTTVVNGVLRTHANAEDHDEGLVAIPTSPAPNTVFEGHVHLDGTQDNFRYVFNEQILNPDGSITVNAVHAYFLGPTATGEVIIGSVTCGVTSG